MKPIYFYRDYRKALADFYQEKKGESASYSYAIFSKKAKLASPNYLKLVVDGTRDLTVANALSFANAIGLKGGEVEYFETLVLENQADSPAEKKYFARKLAKVKSSHAVETIRKKTSTLLDERLLSAVLLCASGNSESFAVEKSIRELGLTSEKARLWVSHLLKEGHLVLDEAGILRYVARHTMMNDPQGASDRQRKYLKEGLNEAQTIFDSRYQKGVAKFLSLLMTAPENSLPDLFESLKGSVEKITEEFDPSEGEDYGVYRVQFQVYRLGKPEN